MKKIVQYLHVNKRMGKWTVHNSRGCFHFDHVELKVPCETVYQPHKKTNPKFFLRCKGTLVLKGDIAEII
jgi:hypothetical protein